MPRSRGTDRRGRGQVAALRAADLALDRHLLAAFLQARPRPRHNVVKRLSQRKDFVKRLSKRAGEEQVGAAARLGNGARAEELAARMRAAGVAPDQRTYTALVRASGKDTERAAAHVAPLPTPL